MYSHKTRLRQYVLQSLLLLHLCPILILAGCCPRREIIIMSGNYFPSNSNVTDIVCLKIDTKKELENYINTCHLIELKDFLNKTPEINFKKSFVCITTNSELVYIQNRRDLAVKPAILRKATPGVGVYIIDGEPTTIIKPTVLEDQPNGFHLSGSIYRVQQSYRGPTP